MYAAQIQLSRISKDKSSNNWFNLSVGTFFNVLFIKFGSLARSWTESVPQSGDYTLYKNAHAPYITRPYWKDLVSLTFHLTGYGNKSRKIFILLRINILYKRRLSRTFHFFIERHSIFENQNSMYTYEDVNIKRWI